MKLAEFIPADPRVAGNWRQELVAGEPRDLPPRDPASAYRAALVANAILSAVKRLKLDAKIEIGGGMGLAADEGDEYRVTDLQIRLPDPKSRGKKSELVTACLMVTDPRALTAEDIARAHFFRRVPTIREVLLFAPNEAVCAVHRRIGEDWEEDLVEGEQGAVRLSRLKGSLFLVTAYQDLMPPEE